MTWKIKRFNELTTTELFQIYQARVNVFIVEQECFYPDVDDNDLISIHVFNEQNGQIQAYGRIIPNQEKLMFGRILTVKEQRGTGLGKELLTIILKTIEDTFPNQAVEIQAQAYLQNFYSQFGFEPINDEIYLEDAIPHIDMIKK
ncbi:GNAT family N-acetyltransferase [Carnobacterium divergens]|uniref:GNAT family N-acetyltransferase n=1 Tax=Carnobacterium divergens TaxID=2748 RepID=A0A7Z8CY43_CARDV|nr:GNAT family N-acetyltransferase [Carnobacterium divergens]TFI72291.1 GNAT family N-acetyltransferase [Carnobacterium divergens]TFI76838.1 GNAT family N-acetyltransferase [Carnobacterium divergens]TFI83021.1 GNAT family N-acetyltransferase [Carnobacterium divergens]TFI95010.1 GNAT family N-acetyltransferase [Carnobacterium divergens]TFJ11542.1 GNAT family N-acetyltransferase [Carnobacterium divergens]